MPPSTAVRPLARAGALMTLLGALLVIASVGAGAAEGEPRAPSPNPGFQGACVLDTDGSGDGDCTIDEPMGNNPATHGTVDFDRTAGDTSDQISFDIDHVPPGMPAQSSAAASAASTAENGASGVVGVQVCITRLVAAATSPYVPTSANTCAGAADDRVFEDEDPPVPNPVVIDLDEAFPGIVPGEWIWFAVHINVVEPTLEEEDFEQEPELAVDQAPRQVDGAFTQRTTYVVGHSVVVRSSPSTTGVTTTTAAPTTTSAAPTTTAPAASVLGVQITQAPGGAELPRTGMADGLLAFGGSLVLLGMSLVLVSRVPALNRNRTSR